MQLHLFHSFGDRNVKNENNQILYFLMIKLLQSCSGQQGPAASLFVIWFDGNFVISVHPSLAYALCSNRISETAAKIWKANY